MAPLEGDAFWDPVPGSWMVMGILLAVLVVLTIVFLVWTAIQRDSPDHSTKDLVDRAVRRDRERATSIRRRLDADSGRADTTEPDLR